MNSILKVLLILLPLGFNQLKAANETLSSEAKEVKETPTPTSETANPNTVGLLAELFPGGGYFYLGDYQSGLLTSTLIIPIASYQFVTTPTFLGKSIKTNSYRIASNVFGFTVYDSYQLALERAPDYHQIIKHEHYTLSEAYFSVFDTRSYSLWSIMPLMVAGFAAYGTLQKEGIHPDMDWGRASISMPLILALTMFIGMGEEAEYRGFQYPAFANLTRSKTIANILQAASFGACHTSWGICSTPYGTGHLLRKLRTLDVEQEYVAKASHFDGSDSTNLHYFISSGLMGLWFGYIADISPHGLLQAMATHTLYDFILMGTDLLTSGHTGRMYLNFSFPISI